MRCSPPAVYPDVSFCRTPQDEGLGFKHVKQATTDIRDILGAIGLQSWPLVTGSKVSWEELETLDRANSFDIFAAAVRAQGPDAWEGYIESDQTLTEAIQRVVKR